VCVCVCVRERERERERERKTYELKYEQADQGSICTAQVFRKRFIAKRV
jgi:hypothetical protein